MPLTAPPSPLPNLPLPMSPSKVPVLDIEIDNLTWPQALERFRSARFVITPNIDHLYNLSHHAQFREVYRLADLVLCDSRILALISPFCFGAKLQQIAGSDYFPAVCRHYASDESVRIFLLGGTTAAHAQLAAEGLKSRCQARIVGYYSPPFGFERDAAQMADIEQRIADSGATVVAVGLGSPKQELLIARMLQAPSAVQTYLAIGATIDFESGLVRRAPKLVSRLGVEWLYRFLQEPKRLFQRYFVHDPLVLLWIVRRRLKGLPQAA